MSSMAPRNQGSKSGFCGVITSSIIIWESLGLIIIIMEVTADKKRPSTHSPLRFPRFFQIHLSWNMASPSSKK